MKFPAFDIPRIPFPTRFWPYNFISEIPKFFVRPDPLILISSIASRGRFSLDGGWCQECILFSFVCFITWHVVVDARPARDSFFTFDLLLSSLAGTPICMLTQISSCWVLSQCVPDDSTWVPLSQVLGGYSRHVIIVRHSHCDRDK